jgi:hypothetical protein
MLNGRRRSALFAGLSGLLAFVAVVTIRMQFANMGSELEQRGNFLKLSQNPYETAQKLQSLFNSKLFE